MKTQNSYKKSKIPISFLVILFLQLISCTQAATDSGWGAEVGETYYFTKKLSSSKGFSYKSGINIDIESEIENKSLNYQYREEITENINSNLINGESISVSGNYLTRLSKDLTVNKSANDIISDYSKSIPLIYSLSELNKFVEKIHGFSQNPALVAHTFFAPPNTDSFSDIDMNSDFMLDFIKRFYNNTILTYNKYGFKISFELEYNAARKGEVSRNVVSKYSYQVDYNKHGILQFFQYFQFLGNETYTEEIESEKHHLQSILIPIFITGTSGIGLSFFSLFLVKRYRKNKSTKISDEAKLQLPDMQTEALFLLKMMKYDEALIIFEKIQELAKISHKPLLLSKNELLIKKCQLNAPYHREFRNIFINEENDRLGGLIQKYDILLRKFQAFELTSLLDPNLFQNIQDERTKIQSKYQCISNSYNQMKNRLDS